MRLVSLEVQNYRNITTSTKVYFDDYTVFIGKNNEGKSNLLRALHCAISMLAMPLKSMRPRMPYRMRDVYDISRDYPLNPIGSLETYFILQIEFDDQDIKELIKRDVRICNSVFIKINIDRIRGLPGFKILKKGKGITKILEKDSVEYRFVAEGLTCVYIGAVRTAGQSRAVATEMLEDIVSPLFNESNFRRAVENIRMLQKPFIEKVSLMIFNELKVFLPDIKGIEIETPFSNRAFSIRDCSLWIDDGTRTPLEEKGDGIQSIASICLLRNRRKGDSSLIIAIEEPEAHLHQGAVHHLRNVLREISSNGQVVITTHNPAFIDRKKMKACHIIEGGVARRVDAIDDIRNVLGIKLSDSLIGSDFILVVEGEDEITYRKFRTLKKWK